MSASCGHLRFETNHEKATQALNYLAHRQGGQINKMKALKLIFFADRYHLRKYGRPIVGDAYWAMAYGPVASMVMNIADNDSWLDECEREYANRYLRSSEDRRYVEAAGDLDEGVFSDSDLEALAFVWEKLGGLSQWQLVDLSHGYPEWQKHRESLQRGTCKRVPMEYADFFLDPDSDDPSFKTAGVTDLFAGVVSQEEKELAEEAAEERSRIESFWNG